MDDIFDFGGNNDCQLEWPLQASETSKENAILVADPIRTSVPPPQLGVAPSVTISTPGLDCNESCSSTPSTIGVETPQMGEQITGPGFRATMVSEADKMNRLNSDLGGKLITAPISTSQNPTILWLLHSCGVQLEEDRFRRILEAETYLYAQDLNGLLGPLFDRWDKIRSLDLHVLGLPLQWKGIQAAVNYLRVLDADQKKPYLDAVARRIGQVLLYFNYEELCRHPEKHCPPSPSKLNVTYVLDCILDAYLDDPRMSSSRQSRRNKITGYHLRRGRWWWRLAGNLGVGILLVGDSSLMSVMCVSQFVITWPN